MAEEPPKLTARDEPGAEAIEAVAGAHLLDEDEPVVDQEANEAEDEVDVEEVVEPPEDGDG